MAEMQFVLHCYCVDAVSQSDACPCRMQLAIDVQLPRCFGGLGGQALYIGEPNAQKERGSLEGRTSVIVRWQ